MAVRVRREEWFADVPRECEWVGESTTSMNVVDEVDATMVEEDYCEGDRLEMCGCVVARRDGRAVVSCGGSMVSVREEGVRGERVRIVFTRRQQGGGGAV